MRNKLIRLVELIQEDFPENLLETFKSGKRSTLAEQLEIISQVIAFHQARSARLWLAAGKQRTAAEREATAQAELAAFLFAYLTGDAREYLDSGIEALRTLGREAEVELVKSLSRR